MLGDKDEIEFDDLGQLQYMGQVYFHMLLAHHHQNCISTSSYFILDCQTALDILCTFHGLIFHYSQIQKLTIVL